MRFWKRKARQVTDLRGVTPAPAFLNEKEFTPCIYHIRHFS
jgi:hypothetical protein